MDEVIKLDEISTWTLSDAIHYIFDCSSNAVLKIDGKKYTYKEIKEYIDNVSGNMRKLSIEKGSYVAIIMENRLEYVISYLALFKIGAVPVLISPRWKKLEIGNVLEDIKPGNIICCEEAGNNKVGRYVSSYINTYENEVNNVFYLENNLYGEKGIKFDQLLKKYTDDFMCKKVATNDVAVVSYTSGTTGKPKGVVINQRNCMAVACQLAKLSVLKQGDNAFIVAPMYSIQGFMGVLLAFLVHATIKIAVSFKIEDIGEEIKKEEDSIFITQPTVCNLVINNMSDSEKAFNAVKKIILAGAACSPELAKSIENKTHCKIQNAYGMTEVTSAACIVREGATEEIRINTVGQPIPGVEVKLVDENRKTLEHNQIGELAVRGFSMDGYYKNNEETQKIIDREGWLYTGDLAKFYDDKNICIIGRNRDMIVRGGMNVFPVDVEECILKLEQVKAVAVVGKPHKILIEQIIAFIIPENDKLCEIKEIYRWLNQNLSNYKVPDKIYLINELPVTASGKVNKQILRDWAINSVPEEKNIIDHKL